MSIQNLKFKVEYDYTDLNNSMFSSYERHVIWRYENLGVSLEQASKEDKEILKRHFLGAKTLPRKEHYDAGIYIQDIENMIAYNTEVYSNTKDVEDVTDKVEKRRKNQILLSQEEISKKKDN